MIKDLRCFSVFKTFAVKMACLILSFHFPTAQRLECKLHKHSPLWWDHSLIHLLGPFLLGCTAQLSTAQHNTAQHSPAQHNTQHSAAQPSTHCTVQRSPAAPLSLLPVLHICIFPCSLSFPSAEFLMASLQPYYV